MNKIKQGEKINWPGLPWKPALIHHLVRDRDDKDQPGLLVRLHPSILRFYILVLAMAGVENKPQVTIANADAMKFARLDKDSLPDARRELRDLGLLTFAPVGNGEKPRAYAYRLLNPRATRTSWTHKKNSEKSDTFTK